MSVGVSLGTHCVWVWMCLSVYLQLYVPGYEFVYVSLHVCM